MCRDRSTLKSSTGTTILFFGHTISFRRLVLFEIIASALNPLGVSLRSTSPLFPPYEREFVRRMKGTSTHQ